MTHPIEVYTKPPGKPLTKTQAGYVEHGPFGCRNCSWFEKPANDSPIGACKPVGGAVDRDGCCDFFNDEKAPLNQGKSGAEYVYVPKATYTCSECRFYRSNEHACSPVLGSISPGASCNKWTP